MSDQSTDVRETSTPSSLFGKKEMDYLQWIALSLQNPPMPVVIKKYLERAQAEGLDPQRIYEAAVKCRPDHWMKAPPYSEVAPNSREANAIKSGRYAGERTQSGTKAIKAMIQVIWDEDKIDLETCYQRESVIEQQLPQDEKLPPLNLPLWEQVAPMKTPAA